MNYEKPKKIPDGRYYVKVSNNDSSRVMVQLNRAKVLTRFSDSDDVTLELTPEALAKVSAIDTDVIEASKANCLEWMGKKVSDQTLETAYTKSSSGESRMNVSKASVKGAIVTKAFSFDKTPIDHDMLDAGAVCDVILEFSGVWFMKKTFGPIWRIAQLRVCAPPKKLYPDEYLFQDADDTPNECEEDDDYLH
jgi:hypothetical protein